MHEKQKIIANVVVGLLDNESPDSNRLTLVTPKSENDVRLQATLGNQNPTGLPVGAVRFITSGLCAGFFLLWHYFLHMIGIPIIILRFVVKKNRDCGNICVK